ncbi:DUF2970 domain-containing protein [Pseudoalteromonas citrea]|uniref:DUF2970 domain-containing protein n=1 Tax=Pseudoalteromonas citrea TaxID=43655 RepID=A0A5S3XKN5_9GAMM|nr:MULTISPECIES: DUF2970 domain-containing protein [Pseudoalteromonas]RJE76017.1 DUF2970 domain-containing protein [Pseudoalteromonas sp. MSK9-3]TMP41262.1 DUF2970 domain-containing protein [Pseudoalteromonas citrea]TMP55468.1 DUF2970 domain-containing protein [Pseudoalteromonas citrea]
MQLLSIIQSVLAAIFGVQSHGKYQHDFNTSSFLPFIVVGIILVIGFVISIALIVQYVLH